MKADHPEEEEVQKSNVAEEPSDMEGHVAIEIDVHQAIQGGTTREFIQLRLEGLL